VNHILIAKTLIIAIIVNDPVNNIDTIKLDNANTSINQYKRTILIGQLITRPVPTVTKDSLSAVFCLLFIV
jgi:hypothetical protein